MKLFLEKDIPSVVIAPYELRKQVLLELDQLGELRDVKFFTKEEFISRMTFTYTKEALVFLCQEYGFKPAVGTMYLRNLKYLESGFSSSLKVQLLMEMKQKLVENGLYTDDSLFLGLLMNRTVYVIGYRYVDHLFKCCLNRLNDVVYCEEEHTSSELSIYSCETLEDEVRFVFSQIASLIERGVSIDMIRVFITSDDYLLLMNRYALFYNIPISFPRKTKISSTFIGKKLLELLKTRSFGDAICALEKQYQSPEEHHLIEQIVSIGDEYCFLEGDMADFIEYELNQTTVGEKKISSGLRVVPFSIDVFSSDYNFILGANQGQCPVVLKDEDFLPDVVKLELGFETSFELNQVYMKKMTMMIEEFSNCVVSYHLLDGATECYPAALLQSIETTVQIYAETFQDTRYSSLYDRIQLGIKLDLLIQYHLSSEELYNLYTNYKKIAYRNFDHRYQRIPVDDLKRYIQPKFVLSYSKIDTYFKCGFRFYLDHILKLRDREENFILLVGNLFHQILSLGFADNYNYDEEVNNYLKDKTLSKKESFLLKKLIRELQFIIETIKDYNRQTGFTESLYEESIFVDKSQDLEIVFMGIVDKILYLEKDNETYVSVVDYKTGFIDTNLNHVIHGLGMQLPIYLYLIRNSKQFQNPKIVGFYLQKILNNEVVYDETKSYEEVKMNGLKLQGYTVANEECISLFDKNYMDSRMIKGMKKGKNGFYHYTKLLTDSQIDRLVALVDGKIQESIDGILEARFDIRPKKIGLENVSCKFCQYRDICFMTYDDVETLKEYKSLEFLGSDNNE